MTGDREGSATFGLPDRLYLVRHGQSTGNLAHAAASAAESELLELETRDMDVPLSDLGRDQAKALGAWLDTQPSEERPTVALTSPYVRAEQTARIALELCCPTVEVHADERLRDRDRRSF